MALTPQEEKEIRGEIYGLNSIIKRLSMRKKDLIIQVVALDTEMTITIRDRDIISRRLIEVRKIPEGKSGIPRPTTKKKEVSIENMSDEDAMALLRELQKRLI